MARYSARPAVPKFPDDPEASAAYAAIKLAKLKKSPSWRLAAAAASMEPMLVGDGNLAAKLRKPPSTGYTPPKAKGHILTKREKRLLKAAKKRGNK